jgi:hypothetical protein
MNSVDIVNAILDDTMTIVGMTLSETVGAITHENDADPEIAH